MKWKLSMCICCCFNWSFLVLIVFNISTFSCYGKTLSHGCKGNDSKCLKIQIGVSIPKTWYNLWNPMLCMDRIDFLPSDKSAYPYENMVYRPIRKVFVYVGTSDEPSEWDMNQFKP